MSSHNTGSPAHESPSSPAQRTVAHYVDAYLGLSETFIYTQLQAAREWRPTVLARSVSNLDHFPVQELLTLPSRSTGVLQRIRERWGTLWLAKPKKLFPTRIAPTSSIIHAHYGVGGVQVLDTCRHFDLPLVVTFYGYDASSLARMRKWKLRYNNMFQYVSLVLCEGSSMAGKVVAMGCPRQKVRIHRIGIDLEQYSPAVHAQRRQPLRIVFCGRFVEKKGVPDAVMALLRCRQELGAEHPFEARFVGDGPIRPAVDRLLMQAGSPPFFRLLGMIPHRQTLEEIRTADIVLQPSRTASDGDSEGGAPTVLIEAQALGIPVVSTRHADIPEIVLDGSTGLLADEGDVNTLVRHLCALIRSRDLRSRLGRAGREHVLVNHDSKRLAIERETLYADVVEEYRRSHRTA